MTFTHRWEIGRCILTAGLSLLAWGARADTPPESVPTSCSALASADFSGVQDAPTRVTEAAVIKVSGDVPAHCRVRAYVAPQVGIELLLPVSNWNRKFLHVGCGGFCGRASPVVFGCEGPLRKGYVCIATDMGHQGAGAEWAYNNLQAEVDYGFRATHVSTLAGKAITERFYQSSPTKSYFMGCSTGGRQALVEAQRFPWDFDGIVAGAPAINLPATLLNILWASLASEDKDGKPILSEQSVQLLHDAALAKCDMDDGLKDSIIGNPRACAFDPYTLVCKGADRNNCLSEAQARAAKKIYRGPTTTDGQQIYTDGAMVGSELQFLGYQDKSPFSRDFFRFLGFMPDAGPIWQRHDFDFDRDYKRLGIMETLYHGSNPDLRRFKGNGGKLILYHGWSDAGGGGIAPLKTVDYYETVEKAMGGRAATEEFLRLFMIPGMGHCAGGTGPNDFDFLSYLEAWVEQGIAPDVIIGAHIDSDAFWKAQRSKNPDTEKRMADWKAFLDDPANRAFTRPIFPYPAYAKYKGSGDPNQASSFRKVLP